MLFLNTTTMKVLTFSYFISRDITLCTFLEQKTLQIVRFTPTKKQLSRKILQNLRLAGKLLNSNSRVILATRAEILCCLIPTQYILYMRVVVCYNERNEQYLFVSLHRSGISLHTAKTSCGGQYRNGRVRLAVRSCGSC